MSIAKCAWCAAPLTALPCTCSRCGAEISGIVYNIWKTWSVLAAEKKRSVPDGVDPDSFVRQDTRAVIDREIILRCGMILAA